MAEEIVQPRREILKLAIIFIVLFLILGVFILYLSWPLLTGTTVVLATQPVDPFDPLRGQYIVIQYEISTIPTIEGIKAGDTVYVSLAKDSEGVSRYSSASRQPQRSGTFIKGKITQVYYDHMGVEYGIEQYFFERNARFETQGMQVEAKVATDGQARISRLVRDGKPIEMQYKNKSWLS